MINKTGKTINAGDMVYFNEDGDIVESRSSEMNRQTTRDVIDKQFIRKYHNCINKQQYDKLKEEYHIMRSVL